jgi:MinD-like ATPase involved in chromosome partitioning or flagellar assembly
MFVRKDCSSTSEPECRNEGIFHVSDHPTNDANAGRRGDHPTTELPPHAPPPPPASEPPTRAFAGFRTERRFGDNSTQNAPLPETRVEPRAWAETPYQGLPRVVESADGPRRVYGNYGGPPPVPDAGPSQPNLPPSRYPELSTSTLLRQVKPAPSEGWRRWLYRLSGQLINVGESPRTIRYNDLTVQVNRPLRGCYRIAMLSLKGGVGKTTITATLGSTLASLRGDRVVGVDANPDRGTLAQKIPLETSATVRHLLRDADRIHRYSDIRAYTSQSSSRLEILASEQDPAVSEAFSEDDYRRTVNVLERFYNIVLTDCGTGLMHSAMKGVLDLAHSLVIVSSSSIDGARSASATLDWLDAHGYRELVSRSVAVINSVRPTAGKVDLERVATHFAARCRSVCRMPFDEHLEEGGEIDLDRLGHGARLAALELAATVADDFPQAVTWARS